MFTGNYPMLLQKDAPTVEVKWLTLADTRYDGGFFSPAILKCKSGCFSGI
jgi:hypothetical protein